MTPPRGLNPDKREAIVKAAIAEFTERGFAATNMDQISCRAGVSKRTVYNHFAGKEELFQTISMDMWRGVMEAVEIDYDPDRSLEEQLRQIATLELEAVSSPDFIALARMTLVEYARQPELAKQVYEQFSQNERGFVVWVKMAVQDGRLEINDHSFAVNQFMSLIKASAFWPQVFAGQDSPGKAESNRIVESTVRMFLDHYARKT